MLLIFLFLISIIFPAAFWWYFFIWQDRAEPEPKKMLIKMFFLGIGAAFLAGALNAIVVLFVFPADETDIFSLMNEVSFAGLLFASLAGVVEELLKFFALREFIYAKKDFNQIADGFFYATALAIGFVVVENSFYLYLLYREETKMFFISASLIRAVATAMMHMTSAGILGYAFGKMKFSVGHSRWIVFAALLLAMSLHIAFNLLVSFELLSVAFLIVFLSFLALLRSVHKQRSQLVWKLISTDKKNNQGY